MAQIWDGKLKSALILVEISMDSYRNQYDWYVECICIEFSLLDTGVIPYPFKFLLKKKSNSDIFFSCSHMDNTQFCLVNLWMTILETTIVTKYYECMGGTCYSQGD